MPLSFPRKISRVVRIVAADDSAFMRSMLTTLFASMAEHAGEDAARLELVAMTADGFDCLEAVQRLRPDIVLLDLEMPRMSGMAALDALQREFPTLPVVMCSASTERGAAATLEALARGATDYITKPAAHHNSMAAIASLSAQLAVKLGAIALQASSDKPLPIPRIPRKQFVERVDADIVGIGVSTGGPAALEKILPLLPADFPVPILIVQHMPRLFTQALAGRLDRVCALRVREAVHHISLKPGTIWLAPGDRHMQVDGNRRIVLHDREPLLHCRPSVNYLFQSLATGSCGKALAVVLTGMGSDGLDGARDVAAAGGAVVVQDQASSAVWGMPGRVAAAGLADAVVALDQMAAFLCKNVQHPQPARHQCKEFNSYAL